MHITHPLCQEDFRLSSYHYHLPPDRIAQYPAEKRDDSRLMALTTRNNEVCHYHFKEISRLLAPGDLLVLNNTKVIPARLQGRKETGGKVEVFLLGMPTIPANSRGSAMAEALIKASKRSRPGTVITLSEDMTCTIIGRTGEMTYSIELHFPARKGLIACLDQCGQVPLPPYISRIQGTTEDDAIRYQTVYASHSGAVAAPTAGLHFTRELLTTLKSRGIGISEVTLHVGYGTFAPVREEDITKHQIHHEFVTVSEQTVAAIAKTKEQGGRVWAVGTTTVRSLEFAALHTGKPEPIADWCDLYIYPGFDFRVIDNLITNFHLPDSSLLFLVAALCGRTTLLECYATAIREGYRFFSYGDAMAIIAT